MNGTGVPIAAALRMCWRRIRSLVFSGCVLALVSTLAAVPARCQTMGAPDRRAAGSMPDTGCAWQRPRCGGIPTPAAPAPAVLAPAALARLLTDASVRGDGRRALVLRDVTIPGPLDLSGMKLLRGVDLRHCRIAGDVDLSDATTESNISFEDCVIAGSMRAERLLTGGSFNLRGVAVQGGLDASQARVGGSMDLRGAGVAGDLTLSEVAIGGNLDISHAPALACRVFLKRADIRGILWAGSSVTGGPAQGCDAAALEADPPGTFDLSEATIGGDLVLSGARLKLLQADRLHAEGLAMLDVAQTSSMHLRGARFEEDLVLGTAVVQADATSPCTKRQGGVEAENMLVKGRLTSDAMQVAGINLAGGAIDGDVDFSRADTACGGFNAANTRVGGNFSFGKGVAGGINLNGADISGSLYLTNDANRGAQFGGGILAYNVGVGGSVYFDGGVFHGPVVFAFAHIGRNVYFKGAPFDGDVNFGGAHLGGLLFGWPGIADGQHRLSLRGAAADGISDAPAGGRAARSGRCPEIPVLDLHGFTYAHFGGPTESDGGTLSRDADWYLCLLKRDPSFSFQPYRQAAGVFRAVGQDGAANIVLRRANLRELSDAFHQGRLFDLLQTGFLGLLIGWGLGWGYLFAVVWVWVFTAVGATLIFRANMVPTGPKLASKRQVRSWCALASLTHFIPLVTLDQECADYLGKKLRLQNWFVRIFFACHAALGYLVGACLAAAVAGLTQAS